ncbi:MAG: pyridoxal-phosphate dependent enzyme [Dongiaceae bacterium]
MSLLDEAAAARPRIALARWPTPLDRLDRLSAELGIELWIKRDDLTGIGAGGNKLRKLEFIAAEAVAAGATCLITTGGPQSNHARITAAVAARLGLACRLMLRGTDPGGRRGNLLLAELFGAAVEFQGDITYDEVSARMAAAGAAIAAAGGRACEIPLGGATGSGTLAYALGWQEIAGQCREAGFAPDLLVCAAGTGSTYAGLLLGARCLGARARLLGVSVSWTRAKLGSEVARLLGEAAALLPGGPPPGGPEAWIDDSFVGPGYTIPTPASRAALLALARQEGVLLDSTYTAKAMSGLVAMVGDGRIPRGARVVFLHTGGTPELYARDGVEPA